ncbi:hypothetical protein [Endozoicomonas sp. SCSIO W0465]|uniref:hypothetical protein n=1 Tax=Endozoicomonas sp. SCSIO W0465 TaxID=2918516 RepID=UPI0020756612|nr:hypothetical protein [Endozoicomonas sp. SCSIO W0465]USE34835.1 hypothetical protein MJO57_22290 [Endozoicomonas sp. SCSIO W0465]
MSPRRLLPLLLLNHYRAATTESAISRDIGFNPLIKTGELKRFQTRLCETKQPAKKRRCRQRVDTGKNGTSASTGRDSTLPMMGHEVSASRPAVIVHPQPMDIDPDYREIIAKFSVTHQHQILPP